MATTSLNMEHDRNNHSRLSLLFPAISILHSFLQTGVLGMDPN